MPPKPECLEHDRSGRHRSGQILEPRKTRKDTEGNERLDVVERSVLAKEQGRNNFPISQERVDKAPMWIELESQIVSTQATG